MVHIDRAVLSLVLVSIVFLWRGASIVFGDSWVLDVFACCLIAFVVLMVFWVD